MSNELGNFLEKLRGKLSLRDAAKKSGLSHTYIRDLEKGLNRKTGEPITPTFETLKRLSNAYNYPYSDLLRMAGFTFDEITGEANQRIERSLTVLSNTKISVREKIKTLEEKEVDEHLVGELILQTLESSESLSDQEKEILKKPYRNVDVITAISGFNLSVVLGILSTLEKEERPNNKEIHDLEKMLENKKLMWGDEELNEDERRRAIEMLKLLFNTKKDTR